MNSLKLPDLKVFPLKRVKATFNEILSLFVIGYPEVKATLKELLF